MLPDSSIDLVIVAIVSVTDLQLYDDVRVVTVGGSDDVRHDFSGTSDVVVFVDVCFWPLPSIDTSTVSNVFVTVLQLFGLGVVDGEQLLPPWISFDDVVTAVVCFLPLRSVDVTSVTYVRVFVSQLFGLGVVDGEQRLLGISVVCTLVVVPANEPLESVTTSVSVIVFVLVTHDWL